MPKYTKDFITQIVEEYKNSGMSINKFAKMKGLSFSTMYSFIARGSTRSVGLYYIPKDKRIRSTPLSNDDREKILKLYYNDGYRMKEISRVLNIKYYKVIYCIKKHKNPKYNVYSKPSKEKIKEYNANMYKRRKEFCLKERDAQKHQVL